MSEPARESLIAGVVENRACTASPWQTVQMVNLASKVGDYIWFRLETGATVDEVKRELAARVDDMEARRG